MEHRALSELRYIVKKEIIEMDGYGGCLCKDVTILQQKWVDGFDNEYWKDIPIVEI